MKFDIGIILSITHGNLLTKIDNVYKILNYMLDDELFTHQLPRAARFCKPFIMKQYPKIEEWDLYKPQVNKDNWQQLLEKAKQMFGDELEIDKVPGDVWTMKDPIEEAQEMFDKDKIITVQVDKPNEPNMN